jgi:hypothetical protein
VKFGGPSGDSTSWNNRRGLPIHFKPDGPEDFRSERIARRRSIPTRRKFVDQQRSEIDVQSYESKEGLAALFWSKFFELLIVIAELTFKIFAVANWSDNRPP